MNDEKRVTKSGMAFPSRPKGCVSFGGSFAKTVETMFTAKERKERKGKLVLSGTGPEDCFHGQSLLHNPRRLQVFFVLFVFFAVNMPSSPWLMGFFYSTENTKEPFWSLT